MVTDLRQTPQYAIYMQSTGWIVEKIDRPPVSVFIKSLGPLGSVIKIQRPPLPPITSSKNQWQSFFYQISPLVRKHHAIMVKIEPDIPGLPQPPPPSTSHDSPLKSHHYTPHSWPLLPTRTLVINLQSSLKTIRSHFKKDARYCLRKAEKNNLKLETGNYETFYHHWQRQAKPRSLWTPSHHQFQALIDSFGPQALTLNCYAGRVPPSRGSDPSPPPPTSQELATGNSKLGTWLAGVVILHAKHTAYYYYASASASGKQLHAPYLLVWEAIKHAKKNGLKSFDFEGIQDPRYKSTKKWAGFSHFKKAFNGQMAVYPGSYSRYFGPLGQFLKLSQSLFG